MRDLLFAFPFLFFTSSFVTTIQAVPRPESRLSLPQGFSVSVIADFSKPRELAVTANGDLIVGTGNGEVMIVPDAEGNPGKSAVFVRLDDAPAAGVAVGADAVYVASQFGVWKVPYRMGQRQASGPPEKIASLRIKGGSVGHKTSSVTIAGERLYVSVGSSCDACDPELDSTRATVQEMTLDGKNMRPKAIRIRNAAALATNPQTGSVWAVTHGQDHLQQGHPYEVGDPITTHQGVADYGWPHCYENRKVVEGSGAKCDHVVVPRLILPAYNAPIGAVFYPKKSKGRYAFPSSFGGGLFVGLHGSWHVPLVTPRVAFIPFNGDSPKVAADWNDPGKQWSEFMGGWQNADGSRIGRPTGLAVGPEGSLFVADDYANCIYRVRYTGKTK